MEAKKIIWTGSGLFYKQALVICEGAIITWGDDHLRGTGMVINENCEPAHRTKYRPGDIKIINLASFAVGVVNCIDTEIYEIGHLSNCHFADGPKPHTIGQAAAFADRLAETLKDVKL
jgi:hypothetical protein